MSRLLAAVLRSSVRSRLALLILVAFLPVVLALGVVAWQNYREETSRATQATLLVRGAAVARIGAVIDSLHETLSALSVAPSVLGQGDCSAFLRGMLAVHTKSLVNVGVLGPDGHLRCSAFPTSVGGGSDAASVGWLARLHVDQNLKLDGVRDASMTHAAALVGAVALPAASGFAGAVFAELRLGSFLVPGLQDHAAFATWLMTPTGKLVPIGSPPDGAQPPPDVLSALRIRDGTTAITRSLAGIPYAYASATLEDGYRVLTGYGAAREFRRAHVLLLRRVTETALLVALGLLAVIGGANAAIVVPLRRLDQAVEGWRNGGTFDADRLRRAPWELRKLAGSFSEATASLTERELQLHAAVAQQELLMQEIHHRVKNNLQIVASLLNLQASRIRQPEARAEFQSARDRVRALATLHRHLYAHGEVHTINMRSFLVELCGQLFQAMGEREGQRIHLDIEAPELQMSSDQAVPLALIVTEAVSNAIKYAFPGGRAGHIAVSLTADPDSARLVVQDDGVGIPAGKVETETGTRDGIGIQLIRGFARQLGASLAVDEGDGTRYVVEMPLRRERRASEDPAHHAATAA